MRRYAGVLESVFCSISVPFPCSLGQCYQQLAGGSTCYRASTAMCYIASTMVFYPELAPDSRYFYIFLLTSGYNSIYTSRISRFLLYSFLMGFLAGTGGAI